MKIAGMEKCSFVDYPGRMAAVVFTPGCNWNCSYCHNRALIGPHASLPWLDIEVTLAWLDDRRGFLDGVVITGGEPTLQTGLAQFIRTIRAKDYLIKLDTNGSRPHVLAELLEEGLLDYVAMDLKAPWDKYEDIASVPVAHRVINESIELLMSGPTDYEFRTTVVPQLTHDDIIAIAHRIRGAKRYVLQQYRPTQPTPGLFPHAPEWPSTILDELENIVESCQTRGFNLPIRATAVAA